MDSLPREIQLEIVKKFDMDTRIKTGIIGKLKVPERVIKLLEDIQSPNGIAVVGFHYIITSKREVITRTISYYSLDFITYKEIG